MPLPMMTANRMEVVCVMCVVLCVLCVVCYVLCVVCYVLCVGGMGGFAMIRDF
jgi:hypothetical protein